MEYFNSEFEKIYNRLVSFTDIFNKVSTISDDTAFISQEFNVFEQFLTSSLWNGESKKHVLTESLDLMKNKMEILKKNLLNNFIPTINMLSDPLLGDLKALKELEVVYNEKKSKLNLLENDLEDAVSRSNTLEAENANSDVLSDLTTRINSLRQDVSLLNGDIAVMVKNLNMLVEKCNITINKIKNSSASLTKFTTNVSVGFIANREISSTSSEDSYYMSADGTIYYSDGRVVAPTSSENNSNNEDNDSELVSAATRAKEFAAVNSAAVKIDSFDYKASTNDYSNIGEVVDRIVMANGAVISENVSTRTPVAISSDGTIIYAD